MHYNPSISTRQMEAILEIEVVIFVLGALAT